MMELFAVGIGGLLILMAVGAYKEQKERNKELQEILDNMKEINDVQKNKDLP